MRMRILAAVLALGAVASAGDDDTERYLIGSIEEKREGIDVMSPGSPLGSALLGKAQGDVVDFEAPGGVLKVEIIEIDIEI